jgi:hypothetical protein
METYVIKFKTTKHGSKRYEYREHTWYLSKQLKIQDLLKMKQFEDYKYAGKIVKADNTAGFDIKLEKDFIGKPFVIYMITWGEFVLKGGKSKNPLDQRSYKAGTELNWTEKGTPSQTNYVWSQIFRESIKQGVPVNFYAMIVEPTTKTYKSHGEIKTTIMSEYEEVEKDLNKLLKKLNGGKVIGEGKLMKQEKS